MIWCLTQDNSLPETGNHDNSGVETIVNNLALTNVSFTEDDFAKASQDMKLDPTLENVIITHIVLKYV